MTAQTNVSGSLKGITKSFGGNKMLNGFNFKIYKGINGSIGPNGAGKTPTIKRGLSKAVRKPVLAVLCALICLLPIFSAPAIGETNNSFPSTFHVIFQGHTSSSEPYPDGTTPALWVRFLNGTDYHPETVRFTFSMEESPEGEYTVKSMLTFDGFYDEVSLPATVSNGRVFIDSTPTIFVVNPAPLVDGNTIQLFQTENLTLSGTVLMDGQPTTLINDYRVASKVVRASYQQTNSSELSLPGPLLVGSSMLFFDPKTGVLTHASSKFSDVLLNKLGVMCIVGGIFDLVDYSENLDFTLVRLSPPLWQLIIIPVAVILLVLVVFLAYRSSKRKKSGRKPSSNSFLKIHLAYASKEEGAHYGF
jgi:energy-coupling factor transporter ATP-binding protein EcfA2